MAIEGINLDTLFEDLMRAQGKPQDYNRLLAHILTSLGRSNFHLHDGVAYVHDDFRQKLISTQRQTYAAAKEGRAVTNTALRISGVAMQGGQGILLPRNACITAAWGKSRNPGNWSLEIRRNGVPISLASIPVAGGKGSSAMLNIDLNEGDWIQLYAMGTGIEHPMGGVEIAWRR